ncbi:MAG: chorismate mutase, partial [Candidatus Tectimicrobiota bacterium]
MPYVKEQAGLHESATKRLNLEVFVSIIIILHFCNQESVVEPIDKLRGSIDAIDAEILKLLNQRADLAIAIGKEKSKRQVPYHVPEREREIYKR